MYVRGCVDLPCAFQTARRTYIRSTVVTRYFLRRSSSPILSEERLGFLRQKKVAANNFVREGHYYLVNITQAEFILQPCWENWLFRTVYN